MSVRQTDGTHDDDLIVETVPSESGIVPSVAYEDAGSGDFEVRVLKVRCHGRVVSRLALARRAGTCKESIGVPPFAEGDRCADFADVLYLCASCSGSEWRALPGTSRTDRVRGKIRVDKRAIPQVSNSRAPAALADDADGVHWIWNAECPNPDCRQGIRLRMDMAERVAVYLIQNLTREDQWEVRLADVQHARATIIRSD